MIHFGCPLENYRDRRIPETALKPRTSLSNLYHDTANPVIAAQPLRGELNADIAIVGAGVTGLSTALHLAERGVRVAVLEAHAVGWGASGRNGGQVNPGLKIDPDVVEREFGADLGSRMTRLAGSAPDFVFSLIERHGIACEARRNGTLRAAIGRTHAALVRASTEQLAKHGAPVEFLDAASVGAMTGTHRYAAALFDRRGGDVNPLSYVRGLAHAARRAGASIFEASHVKKLFRIGSTWRLATASGIVSARKVLLATNGYSDDLWPDLRRTIVPVFGAVAASEPLPFDIASSVMPSRAVLYESGAVTVYYRVDSGNRLIFGGRGPMREVADSSSIRHLLGYAESLWPALSGLSWTHAWGGQLAMTSDHYPHVHMPAEGLMICLGFNGRGVALGTTMGGQLAQRMIDARAAFDMPISALKPIYLHSLWRWGVRAAIAKGRISDWLAH